MTLERRSGRVPSWLGPINTWIASGRWGLISSANMIASLCPLQQWRARAASSPTSPLPSRKESQMAKLSVKSANVSSSSEQVPDEVKVIDARGRTIGVRRMRMSMRRRVLKAITPEMQEREKYLGLAMLAACCSSINDEPIRMPASESELDFLIDRLDDEGFAAIGQAIVENFAPKSEMEIAAEAKN
jgi:hypothetical protein